jgi:hypothetical protein
VKFGSLIADIFHDAKVNAGNSVKMNHRGLVDFNTLEGATLNHQTTYKKAFGSKTWTQSPAHISPSGWA